MSCLSVRRRNQDLVLRDAKGFVAQTRAYVEYPLPQTDLCCGDGFRDAQYSEAIEDGSADLDLSDLPVKVARREALT